MWNVSDNLTYVKREEIRQKKHLKIIMAEFSKMKANKPQIQSG